MNTLHNVVEYRQSHPPQNRHIVPPEIGAEIVRLVDVEDRSCHWVARRFIRDGVDAGNRARGPTAECDGSTPGGRERSRVDSRPIARRRVHNRATHDRLAARPRPQRLATGILRAFIDDAAVADADLASSAVASWLAGNGVSPAGYAFSGSVSSTLGPTGFRAADT